MKKIGIDFHQVANDIYESYDNGEKPKPNNLAYLKHWSQGKINPKKIFSALSDASKSLEYMKDCVEFESKEEVA